jgi:thioredoxin-dependent peroxiredoxin
LLASHSPNPQPIYRCATIRDSAIPAETARCIVPQALPHHLLEGVLHASRAPHHPLGVAVGRVGRHRPGRRRWQKIDLKVGDTAPAFESQDDQGLTWKSSDHLGKKYIVVYFYPGDFTPGCIAQAKKFQENMNELYDRGAEVVGVSGDSAKTHALFKDAYKLAFTLVADEKGNLAKQFGVPLSPGAEVKTKDADKKPLTLKREITTARWTFIIGLDGKIVYKNTKVNPVEDSKQISAILEKLAKK